MDIGGGIVKLPAATASKILLLLLRVLLLRAHNVKYVQQSNVYLLDQCAVYTQTGNLFSSKVYTGYDCIVCECVRERHKRKNTRPLFVWFYCREKR